MSLNSIEAIDDIVINPSVVEGSSYFIYYNKLGQPIPDFIRDNGSVRFYTYEGEEILRMRHHMKFSIIHAKLDPKASKPKIKYYKKSLWKVTTLKSENSIEKMLHIVYFYDKRGNQVGYEYIESLDNVIESEKYDISEAYEEPSEVPHFLRKTEAKSWCLLY